MASLFRFAAVVAFSLTVTAQGTPPVAKPQPKTSPIANAVKVQGCFASSGSLKDMTDKLPIDKITNKQRLNTDGICGEDTCKLLGFKVAASQRGTECWCGNEYPAENSIAEDKNCNVPCPGFGEYTCGGEGFWTVYNTGLAAQNVKSSENITVTSTTTSSAPTTSSTSTQETVLVVTSPTGEPSTKPAGPNVGGIVAGVVVGVLVIAAVAGGVFFYMRRKRIQEIEEEHRRNMAVNSFVKPPGSSGSFSDTRVDPGMAQRRMSSGSIDETQDYSRKILRVTNA